MQVAVPYHMAHGVHQPQQGYMDEGMQVAYPHHMAQCVVVNQTYLAQFAVMAQFRPSLHLFAR